MRNNMSSADRIIRIMIAAVLFVLYYTGVVSGTLGVVLAIVGVVFLLTSFIGFCPLYRIFGFCTKKPC